MSEPSRPFHDLDAYVAIPRIGALRLSPDGRRLVATVSELTPDGKKPVSAIWAVDPDGTAPARRLTRSAPGESAPEFLPDGSLLFTSRRDDPSRTPDDAAEVAALWLLPASGGEARPVASRPGGIDAVAAARASGRVFFTAGVFPGAADADDDAKRRAARTDAGVTALLHEGYPVRHWDHDLGVAEPRLFAADAPGTPEAPLGAARDLTPEPGRALDDQAFDPLPDGSGVVTGWRVRLPRGRSRDTIVRVDAATGEQRTLAGDDDHDYAAPRVSPDGRHLACVRRRKARPDRPEELTLWLVDLVTGDARDLLPGDEHWPADLAWSPDSAHVYFTADASGRRPVFRVAVAGAALTRVTGDDGAYDTPLPAPDGHTLYALRSSVAEPPTPVRVDVRTGEVTALPAPGTPLTVPGTLTEIATTVPGGATVRGWLVLPEGASAERPAPLVMLVHGGPLMSWNSWHWRWNPWLIAARGYAVLLPDPALSTGYGQDFIARGWRAWGGAPYDDLMAITDAAAARADIDGTRLAALGGSFGGYMANWIAGHTDRFACIVTHAGLWALDQMGATTDDAAEWTQMIGDPETDAARLAADTPHAHTARIRTPMLVIHGNRDYRVPIGEGLRLWWDLIDHEVPGVKFLYFPDENHWVLTPGNVKIWYETVLSYLAHHVLNEPWRRPDLV